MIVASPSLVGAVNDTESCSFDGVIPVIVGADGVVTGVPSTMFDCAPAPWLLTARIRTWYVVPFVSPVITSGLDVDAGERDVQLEPLFVEYW